MRRTTSDKTIERSYVQKFMYLIEEYRLVKKKKHPKYKFVSDFYKAHNTNRQTFSKYYNRFLQGGGDASVLPMKRGRKWQERNPDGYVDRKVIEYRQKGFDKYTIYAMLKPDLKGGTPSPSTIYNISKAHGLNRLTREMKKEKVKIIKEKAGELGHIDAHYLSRDLILNDSKRYYLVCVIDDCTRIAWAEVLEDIKSLTVMFATLKSMNLIKQEYNIQFETVMTDNGSEFASRNNKAAHPFERMLAELGVKHIYTRPNRPQTNGKVERFWRTIEEEVFEFSTFESVQEMKDEVMKYMLYYNFKRPHQGIGGKTPVEFLQNLSAN